MRIHRFVRTDGRFPDNAQVRGMNIDFCERFGDNPPSAMRRDHFLEVPIGMEQENIYNTVSKYLKERGYKEIT